MPVEEQLVAGGFDQLEVTAMQGSTEGEHLPGETGEPSSELRGDQQGEVAFACKQVEFRGELFAGGDCQGLDRQLAGVDPLIEGGDDLQAFQR